MTGRTFTQKGDLFRHIAILLLRFKLKTCFYFKCSSAYPIREGHRIATHEHESWPGNALKIA